MLRHAHGECRAGAPVRGAGQNVHGPRVRRALLRGALSAYCNMHAAPRLPSPAAQFGIELDDVTTEKQIIRKEHQKLGVEEVAEDEEVRR